jgi:hypothetical protein
MTLTACQGGAAPLTESGREDPAAPTVGVANDGDAGVGDGDGDGSGDGDTFANGDAVGDITDDASDDATIGVDITAALTDPNFLAAVREKLGKETGEPIYADEAAEFTRLDISGRRIKSLTGIEYFTELTRLDCADNQLESLDVSACGELRYLSCAGNDMLSEEAIIGLDKSKLWIYEFRPQNVVTPRAPIEPATLAAAAAAPPVAQGKYYHSFAGIDPILGPGPLSVNDLIDIYGPPETLAAKRVSVASGCFAIIAYFADVSFELVSGLGELSFATECDMYNENPNFEITEADLTLEMYPFQTIVYGGDYVLPGGIYIGCDRAEVDKAYSYEGMSLEPYTLISIFTYDPIFPMPDEYMPGYITYVFEPNDRLAEVRIQWYNDMDFDTF